MPKVIKYKTRRTKVAGMIMKNILKISVVALAIPAVAFGAQRTNPRGGTTSRSVETDNSVASVISRSVAKDGRQNRSAVVSPSVKARSARPTTTVARTATRSGAVTETQSGKNASRVQTARATAVFNDVSKIGGGYSACRDAYATCMDQICANANDTYRRCYCSDRFTGFRETSENLDTALTMLAQFQDKNLDAVDKSAAEVTAMYMASDGEKAIKKDTSASQKLLNNISNILSGKTTVKTNTSLNSLGVLDFSSFEFDEDDIWGESSSIFGDGSGSNIANLEGKALYNKAHKQCIELVQDSCGSEAIFNLVRSSYSIMISQDCNVVEKSINAKRAAVEETVRTAEKYLRDARLEEYRAHNSADVLECLTKVETAMRNPVACGENYEKCMDYTGRYIDVSTGEAIYSNRLFGLNSLIVLDGSADVLKANSAFDKWLDAKKPFAATALDSCRDISSVVWQEFKRSALIQIAQAQDDRIQKIKDSCVEIIKDCYDTTSETLYDMDDTEMQSTGALVAVASRGTCYDKVLSCSSLYGDQDGCKYDDKTKKLTNAPGKKCGIQSLLTFVDTVDSVKIAEGCQIALTKYAHQLCDPQVGDDTDIVYPMGCKDMTRQEVRAAMDVRRKNFCPATMVNDNEANTLSTSADAYNTNIMNQVIQDIYRELSVAFTAGCEAVGGTWTTSAPSINRLNADFYWIYYGVAIDDSTAVNSLSALHDLDTESLNTHETGWCIGTSEQEQCLNLRPQYDTAWENNQCVLPEGWYRDQCQNSLGGTWNSVNHRCSVSDMFDAVH